MNLWHQYYELAQKVLDHGAEMERGRIESFLWPILWEPYRMDVPYGDFPVVYGIASLCAANAELRYACEQAWQYIGGIPIEEVPSVTDRRDVLSDIKTALENSTHRVIDARVEASHPDDLTSVINRAKTGPGSEEGRVWGEA